MKFVVEKLPQPTPEEVRAARVTAGLNQTQATQLISPVGAKGYRTWQRFEFPVENKDHRAIHPGLWELFLLLTDQHPVLKVVKRRAPSTRNSEG